MANPDAPVVPRPAETPNQFRQGEVPFADVEVLLDDIEDIEMAREKFPSATEGIFVKGVGEAVVYQLGGLYGDTNSRVYLCRPVRGSDASKKPDLVVRNFAGESRDIDNKWSITLFADQRKAVLDCDAETVDIVDLVFQIEMAKDRALKADSLEAQKAAAQVKLIGAVLLDSIDESEHSIPS